MSNSKGYVAGFVGDFTSAKGVDATYKTVTATMWP